MPSNTDANKTNNLDTTTVQLEDASGVAHGTPTNPIYVSAGVTTGAIGNLPAKWYPRLNIGDTVITGTYVTLYNRASGGGYLLALQFGFDTTKAVVKVTIDGNVMFEVTFDDVKSLDLETDASHQFALGGLVMTTKGNTLNINFPYPIKYATSLKVEVKTSDAASHKNKFWYVSHTEGL